MSKIENPDTTISDASSRVWGVNRVGSVYLYVVYNDNRGVRPVINLLKSSI